MLGAQGYMLHSRAYTCMCKHMRTMGKKKEGCMERGPTAEQYFPLLWGARWGGSSLRGAKTGMLCSEAGRAGLRGRRGCGHRVAWWHGWQASLGLGGDKPSVYSRPWVPLACQDGAGRIMKDLETPLGEGVPAGPVELTTPLGACC